MVSAGKEAIMATDLKLRGVIPRDLSSVEWVDWPLPERITAARALGETAGFSTQTQQCAVAVTMIEQPGKIPCGNAIGMMPFGKKEPWGWRAKTWANVKPVGYALIREGAGGKMGVFFAFHRKELSLELMMEIVKRRRMYTGAVYAERWVATEDIAGPAATFDATLRMVKAAWGGGE